MNARRLKKVVIKEELFALTGDTFEAIILGQLIYWQERVEDFDKYLEEEKRRAEAVDYDIDILKTNGWIYKKSSELKEECLLSLSEQTIRRYIQSLDEKKLISSRKNPMHKWDRTLQYRVNIDFIIEQVKNMGYDGLSGWTNWKQKNDCLNLQNGVSNIEVGEAIPEITNIDYKTERKKEIYKEIVDFWNENTKSFSKVRSVTAKVKSYIDARIRDGYSVDDIKKALLLCESLDDFYKGKQEGKKWKADFFWIMANTNANFDKILTGALHTSSEQERIYHQVMSEEESNGYYPDTDGSISYNSYYDRYITYHPLDLYPPCDGYTDENRPEGAELYYQGIKNVWSREQKKWLTNGR